MEKIIYYLLENLSYIITIGISVVIACTINIIITLKWVININEITDNKRIRKDFERKSLENWWECEKFNFIYKDKKIFALIDDKEKQIDWATKKYKRLLKLRREYNEGKLLVIKYQK